MAKSFVQRVLNRHATWAVMGLALLAVAFFWPTIVGCWMTQQKPPANGGEFGSMFDSAAAVFAALAFLVALYALFSERAALDVSKELNAQVAGTVAQQNKLLEAQAGAQNKQTDSLDGMSRAVEGLRDAVRLMGLASQATVNASEQTIQTMKGSQAAAEKSMTALVDLSESAGRDIRASIQGTTGAMQATQQALSAQAERADVSSQQLGVLVERLTRDERLRQDVLEAQRAQFQAETNALFGRDFGDRMQRLQQSIYRFQAAHDRDGGGFRNGGAQPPDSSEGIDAVRDAVSKFRSSIETRAQPQAWQNATSQERLEHRGREVGVLVAAGLRESSLTDLVRQIAIHTDWLESNRAGKSDLRYYRQELAAIVPVRLRLVVAYALLSGTLEESQTRSIVAAGIIWSVLFQPEEPLVEPIEDERLLLQAYISLGGE